MFGSKKIEESKFTEELIEADSLIEEVDDQYSTALESVTAKSIKPSVISEGFIINGDIKSEGQLTVEGSFIGDISVDSLIVGVSGSVGGVINAKVINVKGILSGKIHCQEIIVGGRSIVDGELTYSAITIQRGGIVKGDINQS
jgi:cytoskeletal protein CcmA (bactofilin family)